MTRRTLWKIVTSLAALLFIFFGTGFAQDPRETCIENFGYLGCDAEGNPIPPQQPNNRVVLYWTALALSETKMKPGASHGQNSAESAKQEALASCRRNGPTDCKILTYASNRCLALALGSNGVHYGYSPADDRQSAAAGAMKQCRSAGGANCTVITSPCAADDPKWATPLPLPTGLPASPVDPKVVGTWQLLVNPGYWIWRVAANGTYEFHSEAMDGARTNAGTFTASNGKYKLHAINLTWDDEGTYTFQGPDTMLGNGKLGPGTWHRIVPREH